MGFTGKTYYPFKIWSFLGKWFPKHFPTPDVLDFFIVAFISVD